jgi:hypothetical protein
MASGSYRYLLNGQSTEVAESWDIEGELAAECQISSLRVAPGVEIEVTAGLSNGKVQHFTSVWRSGSGETISAQYLLQAERVLVTWRAADSTTEEVIEVFHAGAISRPLLFPLMRIFSGPLIAQILRLGGEGNVILPDINDPGDGGRLLRPLSTQRRARVIESDAVLSLDGIDLPCRACEYTGWRSGQGRCHGRTDRRDQRQCRTGCRDRRGRGPSARCHSGKRKRKRQLI